MFSSIAPEKVSIPSAETALPGRAEKLQVADRHAVTGNPMTGPFPDNLETAVFGMGCFWGAERLFWKQDGVFTTAAGYAGGHTENPTYREVCSGRSSLIRQ